MDYTQPVNTEVFRVTANDADPAPFNSITYSIIGDGAAAAVFRIQQDGRIFLNLDNSLETATVYTIRVKAEDNGVPSLSSVATISVNVNRNLQSPTFQQQQYFAIIQDLTSPGTGILTVSARDADLA
ncbi:hypothetical protein ACJMK2_035675, partial [Sinanodonta woodiana]